MRWHEEQRERLRPGRRIVKRYFKDVGETKRILGDHWHKVRAAFQTGELNAGEVCYAIDVGRMAKEMQVPVNMLDYEDIEQWVLLEMDDAPWQQYIRGELQEVRRTMFNRDIKPQRAEGQQLDVSCVSASSLVLLELARFTILSRQFQDCIQKSLAKIEIL